ncbi:hypothetical protein PsorP6_013589 [Peronosclerospora sorghi]|uniref:Uncharacterized protein n=1 Tax=Peronosclerospora sorghi TaxID=230839 RepID=A0ACC0VHL5_9STRA|nr:hypothetical protein PsorP6_013589 [Peronosclerospora sorghi]
MTSTIAPNLETSRNSSRTASRVAVDSKKADVHEATSASLPPIYSSRSKASDVRASSTHDGKTDPESPIVDPMQEMTPTSAATTTVSSSRTNSYSARPSVSTSDGAESVTTKSRQDGCGSSAGTYVATGLGCLAVVAAVVMVLFTQKKKQALDEKEYYRAQYLMTPVTEISVF